MSRPHRSPRHRSRQVALQVLYAADLVEGASSGPPPPVEEIFDRIAANFDLPEGARAFGKELVCGALEQRAELDALLAAHARNWRVSRMATVDRNILRLASYELVRTDTPAAVVIDEAIELARRFGDDPSSAFVNGVLDSVAREVRAGEDRQAARGNRGE